MVTALRLSELPQGCVRALTALGTFGPYSINKIFLKSIIF